MRDKSPHPDVRKQMDSRNVSLLSTKWPKSPEEQIPSKIITLSPHQAIVNVFYLNAYPPCTTPTFLLPPGGEMESVSSLLLPLERQTVQIIVRP